MEAKEKAKKLVDAFKRSKPLIGSYMLMNTDQAKQCALLCVKEIELYRRVIEKEYSEDLYHAYGIEEYWKKVRSEINKL